MAIAKGVSLGPYEIVAPIGAGGMGEVWRARDSRIGRDVAIKVLAGSFVPGDERVWRFEQEARAAGALNHPGLVTIFDVGTTDGSPYIVMELLEGETVRDAIGDAVPGNPMSLRKVIDYAIQIASALAVAHEKGIIHRDLKPENLFITSEGRVKILDFGLAKLAGDVTEANGGRRTARHLTSAGIAVGTPGYMSPEQVRAQPLDHRTDIFSFGSVLYEMISGHPAFDCFSAVETMHAVLNVEPEDLPTLMPNVPPSLDAIVRHCLEKQPRDRFQSARDLAFQLRTLPALAKSTAAMPSLDSARAVKRLRTRPMLAIASLLLLAGATAGGFALFRRSGGGGELQGPPRTFKQLTFSDGPEIFPTFAPDGKSFAYVSSDAGNRDIYVQRIEGRIPVNITSDSPDADAEPAFSPDGSQIAFRSERGGGGIFVMGVTGENVRRLTNFGHNPSWSPDGTHLVVSTAATDLRPHVHPTNGDLWLIDARTGGKRPLFTAGRDGDYDAVQPSWSPHGHRIAFWGVSERGAQRDIMTIDPDAPQPKDSVVKVTTDPSLHWNPVWSPDGRHLYFGSNRDGTMNLWRIAIDEESGKPDGAAEPVSLPAAISGNFGFSQQGDMIFTTVMRFYRLLSMPFDAATGATGQPKPLFGGSQEILSFEPSPDGSAIAFTTAGTQEDLFVANADGTRLRQLTNDAARDRGVTWSADGTTLYFYSNREEAYHLWSIGVDGSNITRVTGGADLRRIGARNVYTPSASPDGRTLAAEAEGGIATLVHLDRPIAQRLEVIGKTIGAPRFSPDGKQLVGDASRRRGIAVYSLETRKVTPVLDRGLSPQWLASDNRIAFFEKDSICILDPDRRSRTTAPFKAIPGVDLDDPVAGPRLSRNGTELYVRQTLEQGDIWMVHFEKE